MIYFCADDYGLCDNISAHIKQCIDMGALNKVSVCPNFGPIKLPEVVNEKNFRVSLHLNLVEGRCMADAKEINLIADRDGNFIHTFGGLLRLGVFKRREVEAQLYKEIKAQVLYWKTALPDGVPFCVDSHQHTHMIPAVFKTLLRVLKDERIEPEYIRIPAEPLMPYIMTPSLYFTYRLINIVKQWLLKILWQINKRQAIKYHVPTSYFMGILFSGRMDSGRVNVVLPKYIKMAERDGKDIEVLFHPGYLDETEKNLKEKNIVFEKFYLSKDRKTEFDSVINISKGSVL